MTDIDLVHRCMIIPDAVRDEVKALAESFAKSTAYMWNVPLNSTGNANDPPTHWISSGFITKQFADILPFSYYAHDPKSTQAEQVWVTDPYNAIAFVNIAESMGVVPLPSADYIANLMSQCDVSDQEALAAMERLGLKHLNTSL